MQPSKAQFDSEQDFNFGDIQLRTIADRTETVAYLRGVVCNRCAVIIYQEDIDGLGGVHACAVDYIGGYGSPVVGDMTRVKFDLCEKCLMEIVKDFKIDPVDNSYWG